MPVRRKKIQGLVRQLLTDNGITQPPVVPQHLARTKGARIYFQTLEGSLSGFLYRTSNESVIGVNTHHAKVRQNFTVAHELGHLLLHDEQGLHVDHAFNFRNSLSAEGIDDTEIEANFFAAELLMPREFLANDLEGEDHIDLLDDGFLRDLAARYGVSTQSLVYRLMNLGYIQE